MKKSPRPPCFESDEQWAVWQSLSRIANNRDASYCVDCLPEYRDAMIAECRCGFPGVVFVVEQGGSIAGIRPGESGWKSAVFGRYTFTSETPHRSVISMPSREAVSAAMESLG